MKSYLVALLADVLLLAGLHYVASDLGWRVAFASAPHGHTATGYATSFSYSLFTQVFTMSGSGGSLSSPLTLDWVQVLVFGLAVTNGWLLYSAFMARRRSARLAPSVAK